MFMELWNKHKKWILAVAIVLIAILVAFFVIKGRIHSEQQKQAGARQEHTDNNTNDTQTSEDKDSDNGAGLVVEESIDDTTVDSVTAPKNWGASEKTSDQSGSENKGQENTVKPADKTDTDNDYSEEEDTLKDDKVWSRPR